jgi:hypothetical protein
VGGAFVAGAAGNGALRSNAGGLAAVHLYALEATYGRATEAGPSAWGVSIVDSKTNPAFAGGVSYSRGSVGDDTTAKQDDYASQQIRLGLGLPLGEGDTRFAAVFAQLKAAGYSGDFILQSARQDDDISAARSYLPFTRKWVQTLKE